MSNAPVPERARFTVFRILDDQLEEFLSSFSMRMKAHMKLISVSPDMSASRHIVVFEDTGFVPTD